MSVRRFYHKYLPYLSSLPSSFHFHFSSRNQRSIQLATHREHVSSEPGAGVTGKHYSFTVVSSYPGFDDDVDAPRRREKLCGWKLPATCSVVRRSWWPSILLSMMQLLDSINYLTPDYQRVQRDSQPRDLYSWERLCRRRSRGVRRQSD